MTNQDYISSGILELYAAGGLTDEEKAEVEEMAGKHPEIRTALDEIQQAMETYAELHAVTPPAGLKSRILNNITPNKSAEETTPQILPETHKEAKIIDFNGASSERAKPSFSWLAAAAVALLVLSGALNFYFYKNWKSAENNLAFALNNQQQMANNYQTVQQKVSQTELAMGVLENENTKNVKLMGMPKSPTAKALVHWNPVSKTVLLNVKNLPTAPAGHQYQLWALDNGKPIDAGMVTIENGIVAFQQMKPITNAQAFAVTLEPTGGSVNPTMQEMYLMGAI